MSTSTQLESAEETAQDLSSSEAKSPPPHPRNLGWFGTACIAMGGSNQSLFLISALLIGQDHITGQGSAAIPLLILGLLLSFAAMPGWIELTLMFPNRVGGIAATCAEAFKPYSEVLANLAGVCYWWGWIPTCGISAIISASAIQQWYMPWANVYELATLIVLIFTWVNIRGIHFASMVTIPIAVVSGLLALLSGLIPIFAGTVNWQQATTFHLTIPFSGAFGELTSLMAGLYLIGFAAPAFEQAACHTGEQKDPLKNQPRSMYASALMACVYFILLPIVWLGVLGPEKLAGNLSEVLDPTFAPLFGAFAKAATISFVIFNLFHDTIAPLAGASRTLLQLADDGLMPRSFSLRTPTDAPATGIIVTAVIAIIFLWIGDPIWLIAAANFCYLIGICLPNVAVWLLRKDKPDMIRPWRAKRGMIGLGLMAAVIWTISTVLGFEQFGLPTVIVGVCFAYSGSVLYAWRKMSDRALQGLPLIKSTLHVKLTGTMLLVLILDAVGYLVAVSHVNSHPALITALSDIFVVVAMLTICIGLILPGMIAHSVGEVAIAMKKLALGTMEDFNKAMIALGQGNLSKAKARIEFSEVKVTTNDEVGEMAACFNSLQLKIMSSALSLNDARVSLIEAREKIEEMNQTLEKRVKERTLELENAQNQLVSVARKAGMAEVATNVLHNVGNVLNSVNVSADVISEKMQQLKIGKINDVNNFIKNNLHNFTNGDENKEQISKLSLYLDMLNRHFQGEQAKILEEISHLVRNIEHIKEVIAAQQSLSSHIAIARITSVQEILEHSIHVANISNYGDIKVYRDYDELQPIVIDHSRLAQIVINLLRNSIEALQESATVDKKITISLKLYASDCIKVQISDNGIGIAPENLLRMFSHGFTTKKKGHGFGMHSAFLAAKELRGNLSVTSQGLGKGAAFTLELPYETVKGQAKEEETVAS